jgi:hypothetical protein
MVSCKLFNPVLIVLTFNPVLKVLSDGFM